MSVCVIRIYSKSSGNTFRSQILPLLGGEFEKQKNSRNHSCACHWEKKRLMRWIFAAKLSTAEKRTPAPSKLSVPFSYLNFEDLPNIPWKNTYFPTVLPILNPQEFLLNEVLSCPMPYQFEWNWLILMIFLSEFLTSLWRPDSIESLNNLLLGIVHPSVCYTKPALNNSSTVHHFQKKILMHRHMSTTRIIRVQFNALLSSLLRQ